MIFWVTWARKAFLKTCCHHLYREDGSIRLFRNIGTTLHTRRPHSKYYLCFPSSTYVQIINNLFSSFRSLPFCNFIHFLASSYLLGPHVFRSTLQIFLMSFCHVKNMSNKHTDEGENKQMRQEQMYSIRSMCLSAHRITLCPSALPLNYFFWEVTALNIMVR